MGINNKGIQYLSQPKLRGGVEDATSAPRDRRMPPNRASWAKITMTSPLLLSTLEAWLELGAPRHLLIRLRSPCVAGFPRFS